MSSNRSENENIGLPVLGRRRQAANAMMRVKDRLVSRVRPVSALDSVKSKSTAAARWALDRPRAERIQQGVTWVANRTLTASFEADPTAKALFEFFVDADKAALREVIQLSTATQLSGAKVIEDIIFGRDAGRSYRIAINNFRAMIDGVSLRYDVAEEADARVSAVWLSLGGQTSAEPSLARHTPTLDEPMLRAVTLSLTLALNAYISQFAIEVLPETFEFARNRLFDDD